MSKEVKRFSPDTSGRMREWPDGDYVTSDDYDALGAELAEANADFVRIANEREAILAERDALKKDAERYRWLRNSERMIGEYADGHEHNICVSSADGEDVLWFDQLDTAIDAALQGAQP